MIATKAAKPNQSTSDEQVTNPTVASLTRNIDSWMVHSLDHSQYLVVKKYLHVETLLQFKNVDSCMAFGIS